MMRDIKINKHKVIEFSIWADLLFAASVLFFKNKWFLIFIILFNMFNMFLIKGIINGEEN